MRGTAGPGCMARPSREGMSGGRIALRSEEMRTVRCLDIARSRRPALRRRRPGHPHGCGRARWEGNENGHCSVIISTIKPRDQVKSADARARAVSVAAKSRWTLSVVVSALGYRACKEGAVGAGDRRGDGREELQAALADVGRLVDRPTGAPHALYRGVWRLGRFGRPEERCRGWAWRFSADRHASAGDRAGCGEGFSLSWSYPGLLPCSRAKVSLRGISWLSWSNGRTRRPAGRRHGGMRGLRYWVAMNPARKRTVRLVVALSAAVVLASALIYTSFSAASPALSPSQLVRQAQPGRSYQLTGTVVENSVHRAGAVLQRRGPRRRTTIPVAYTGTVPDPFREGREVIVTGREARGRYVGERDSLITSARPSTRPLRRARSRTDRERIGRVSKLSGRTRLRLPAARAGRLRVRHRRLAVWGAQGQARVLGFRRGEGRVRACGESSPSPSRCSRSPSCATTSPSTRSPTPRAGPRRPSTARRPCGPRRKARCCCGPGCCRCGRAWRCSSRASGCATWPPTRRRSCSASAASSSR